MCLKVREKKNIICKSKKIRNFPKTHHKKFVVMRQRSWNYILKSSSSFFFLYLKSLFFITKHLITSLLSLFVRCLIFFFHFWFKFLFGGDKFYYKTTSITYLLSVVTIKYVENPKTTKNNNNNKITTSTVFYCSVFSSDLWKVFFLHKSVNERIKKVKKF